MLRKLVMLMCLSLFLMGVFAENIIPIKLPDADNEGDQARTIEELDISIRAYIDAKISGITGAVESKVDSAISQVDTKITEQITLFENKIFWLAITLINAILFSVFLSKALEGLK